ncbi:MAG: hypothetical protein V7K32_00385 [Nostoc sp.]|uniref:hypothetical protein n=1 Tax=Nostoc sp. TaxID=1180 RepID=UPI002FFC0E01
MLASALIQFWGVSLILKFPDMCLKATESTAISQIFNLELSLAMPTAGYAYAFFE